MLPADADAPPVPQPAVRADLLEAFQVVTQLGGDVLRKHLTVLARFEILLTIQEPHGYLELSGILNDRHELFNFVGGQFAGASVQVDFGFFANQVGKATTDTGNFRESKYNIALPLDVGVENTQNVLKFRSLNERRGPVCEGK